MPNTALEGLISVREAATLVGVTTQAVRARYHAKRLAGAEVGGIILIERAALAPWIAEREVRARKMLAD